MSRLNQFIGRGVARSSQTGQTGLSRRQILAGGTAAGVLGLVAPYVKLARAESKTLVYATWGGSWEEAQRKAWFDPFTASTGIKVQTVQGPDYGKVRAMVRAGNTEWDVVEVNPNFMWIGIEQNLLEKIDFNVVKVNADKDLYNEYSAPQVFWSRVMVYNAKKFSKANHPKNWAEFWDVKKYPGKRALMTRANSGTLEFALMADGVPGEKLYPLDLDRAFASLDKIKDHVIWFDTNTQIVQLMSDEVALLGMIPDGRALGLIEKGAPLAVEYNQSLASWTVFVVPKGAPNRENAMKLIAWMVSAKAQADFCNIIPYGPTNPAAFKLISPERAKVLSGGPQQQGKAVRVNEKWWKENLDAVDEKFAAWRLR